MMLGQGRCWEYLMKKEDFTCSSGSNEALSGSGESSFPNRYYFRKRNYIVDGGLKYVSKRSSKSSYISPPYQRRSRKSRWKSTLQRQHNSRNPNYSLSRDSSVTESYSRRCFTPHSRCSKRRKTHSREHRYMQHKELSNEQNLASSKELILYFHHKFRKKHISSYQKYLFCNRDEGKRIESSNVKKYIKKIKSRYLTMCEEELDCGCPIIKQRLYRTSSKLSFCSHEMSHSSRSRNSDESRKLSSSTSWYSRSRSSDTVSSVSYQTQSSFNCYTPRSISRHYAISESATSSSTNKTNSSLDTPKSTTYSKNDLPLNVTNSPLPTCRCPIGSYYSNWTRSENNLRNYTHWYCNRCKKSVWLKQHEQQKENKPLSTSHANLAAHSKAQRSDTDQPSWIISILSSFMPTRLVNFVGRFRNNSLNSSMNIPTNKQSTAKFSSSSRDLSSSYSSNEDSQFNIKPEANIYCNPLFYK